MDYRESLMAQGSQHQRTAGFYGWAREHRQLWLWLTFVLVAIAVELPFLLNNHLFGGWDQQFHVNRIEELYLSAKNGVWHNAISTYTFRGSGLGIQIFYPYIFLYPYAILRLIGLPGIMALYLGNAFYIVASCWISYWCMRVFLKLRAARRPISGAWLFAILYNLSGYMVFNETVRFDLPEAQSMMWYPILFLGLYLTLTEHRRGWLLTTLGATMLVYTHVLSALLAAGMVVVVLALGWRNLNRWQTWLDLVLTAVVTGLLSLPELLGMLGTTKQVTVASPLIGSLAKQAISPFVAVVFGVGNVTKTGLLTHGVTLGTIVLLALVALWIGFRHLDRFGKTLAILSTVLFWMTTKLFPWRFLEHTPINLIQHPWRFYTFISFFVLVAFVILVDRTQLRFNWQGWIVGLSLLLTMVTGFVYAGVSSPKVSANSYEQFATDANYFDYAPKRSVHHLKAIYAHQAVVFEGGKAISHPHVKMAAQPNGTTIRLPKTVSGHRVDLPVFNYGSQHYVVKTDDAKRLHVSVSERGTVQVHVPEGTKRVSIEYHK
ncbi:glycosyltransferase family protein [Furfurilactobacillus rossiae]|uniref:hypothetical protein n=1 Tax=Furfurilactobacillus rossiae TaxID=231049 RepID=UPI0015B7AFCD|nr:hypothetical protein [Furfurilactobacillus rossiae]